MKNQAASLIFVIFNSFVLASRREGRAFVSRDCMQRPHPGRKGMDTAPRFYRCLA